MDQLRADMNKNHQELLGRHEGHTHDDDGASVFHQLTTPAD